MVVTKKRTNNEVAIIAGGLNSISDHDIPDETHSVNFHGNRIAKIDGLSSPALGRNLHSLDLSSNRIRVIENLDSLVNLRLLNLAANLISFIGPGLSKLSRLECLNLSYNQIANLNGLQSFANIHSNLEALFLHGNEIDSMAKVAPLVGTLKSVKSLTFEMDGASNPFCQNSAYPSQIWAQAPHLLFLDGVDSNGENDNSKKTAIQEEAELAGLLGFLTSEDDDDDSAEILDESSSDPFPSQPDETLSSSNSDSQTQLVRDAYPKIESVLSQFRHQPGGPKRIVSFEKASDNVETDENVEADVVDDRLALIEKQLQDLLRQRESTDVSHPKEISQPNEASQPNRTAAPQSIADGATQTEDSHIKANPKTADDDAYLRNLLGQLDEEREKRWTTQKKVEDLSIELNGVNEKRAQERRQIEEALTLVRRLQARLDSGKASQKELEKSVDSLSASNEKLERDLRSSRQKETALQRLLKEVQEKANRQMKEKEDRIKVVEDELEEVTKEAKLAESEASKFKKLSEELKTLLAEKEKEHQESLRGKYSIGSAEIQTLLTKEGDRIAETYKMQVQMWRRKYEELEDEFRLALHLEADRFSALQKTADETRKDNDRMGASLSDLTHREARASALVKELSDLVKVQKTKMAEMSKAQQNSLQALRKKCDVTEAALNSARDRLKVMEEAVAAKDQLETKCAALETLVKNVKAEKELWSSELAHQGAALSQDRGRLEAKLEALTAEVTSLKKQLERDADSLRIKGKVIDDQTETIKKLKDGLLDRDRRIKEMNEVHLAKDRDSENKVETETRNRLAAEERIDYLENRKEELKAGVAAAEEEMESLKSTNEKLIQKWKDRSKLIDSLEVKVAEMKSSWDEKEAALMKERDAALAEKEETRSKSAAIDAAFRSQLDQAQAAHARTVAEMDALKNLEIEQAKEKLAMVEEEMREILRESAVHKAQMQLKIKKLTSAFADLQS